MKISTMKQLYKLKANCLKKEYCLNLKCILKKAMIIKLLLIMLDEDNDLKLYKQ